MGTIFSLQRFWHRCQDCRPPTSKKLFALVPKIPSKTRVSFQQAFQNYVRLNQSLHTQHRAWHHQEAFGDPEKGEKQKI